MRTTVEKPTKRKYRFTITALTIALLFLIVGGMAQYTSSVDGVAYNNKVGSYLTLAAQAQSFNQKSAYIAQTEAAIKSTFPSQTLNTTYDSPFYFDHIYARSVGADLVYLQNVQTRIQIYNQTYKQIVFNSSNVILMSNWYSNFTSTINNLLSKDGNFGLPYRLQQAYFVNYGNPLDYWTGYLLSLAFFSFVIALLTCILEADSSDYYYVDSNDGA